MATVPIEYDASPSKTGVHVPPELVVFHTPPDALATYQIFLSRGCAARSAMRPDVIAGPIDRNLKPANGAPPPRAESPCRPPESGRAAGGGVGWPRAGCWAKSAG